MVTAPQTVTKNDLLQLKLPATIDEVISQLEQIIAYCETTNSPAGYFAALYHKVTCRVKECIGNKNFEDGIRMEKLDVAFATRYLNAYYLWLDGKETSASWKIAFDAFTDNSTLVIQHLLLGMNAHINFDLGVSTGLIMQGVLLEGIHNDFNTINGILASMIDNVEDCLTTINPLMKLLDLKVFKYDEMLVSFSISTARDGAWSFAEDLSNKHDADYESCINARDQRIAQLGNSIANSRGFLLKMITNLIRLFEKKNVADVIKKLGV
ncbi:MAG: DUF5995 family protein [Ginsengibacter sp.]